MDFTSFLNHFIPGSGWFDERRKPFVFSFFAKKAHAWQRTIECLFAQFGL